MGKVKYQGGLTKLLASKLGAKNKLKFAARLPEIIDYFKHQHLQEIKIELVSFSSTRDFEDQVLSILSFLRYVGKPAVWHLYSDGSHTPAQVAVLEKGFSFIKIKNWDFYKLNKYNDIIDRYTKVYPTSKKLQIFAGHPFNGTTIFLDADVLFGKLFIQYLQTNIYSKYNWYLPDVTDISRIGKIRNQFMLNFGFLIINEKVNFDPVFEELQKLNYNFQYFSDQDALERVLPQQGYLPLDPRSFLLDSSDQFDWSYLSSHHKYAIRHYTGPVRHKMWQKNWKWHLSI